MSVDEMTIGERIRAARKSAGLTQAQLAERCGVAMVTIQQYEHNKRQPRVEKLKAIAAALDVSVNYFLGIPQDRVSWLEEVAEYVAERDGIDKEDALRAMYSRSIQDEKDRIALNDSVKFSAALQFCDEMTISGFYGLTYEMLKRTLLEYFRELNRRGKIEAVLRLRELRENLRFTSQDDPNQGVERSMVTWDD